MLLLPLLQDATPDTVRFMLLGYAFVIGLPLLYLLSWFVRRRSLERDLETIDALTQAEKSRARLTPTPDSPQPADKPSRS